MSVQESQNSVTFNVNGKSCTMLLQEKDFRTGSKGFFTSGKIELPDGRRLQVVCNLVIIGSKQAKTAAAK